MITVTSLIFNIVLIVVIILVLRSRPPPDDMCVEMKPSPIHGRGMFAKRPIKSGQLIEAAPLIFFNRENDLTSNSVIKHYDMNIDGKTSSIMLGYATIYNHSDDNNAKWLVNGDQIYITALRDIQTGDEVFVNYGPKYWIGKDGQKK